MPEVKPEKMYYLAPLLKQPDNLLLPQSMYQHPVVAMTRVSHTQTSEIPSGACKINGTSECSGDANAVIRTQLSARQEAVLERLHGLQRQLDKIKSIQPQPSSLNSSDATIVQNTAQFQKVKAEQSMVLKGLSELKACLSSLLQPPQQQQEESQPPASEILQKAGTFAHAQESLKNTQESILPRLQSLREHVANLKESILTHSSIMEENQELGNFLTSFIPTEEQNCQHSCEEAYALLVENHSSLLSVLKNLREQVLQLPLLVPRVTEKSSSKCVSDAVSVDVLEQHQAVLHKLLLLQHRLSKLIRQPGCPLWHPCEQSGVCHDLVIRASPSCAPYSVLVLAGALRDAGCTVQTTSLLHSSLQQSAVPAGLQERFRSSSVRGGGRADHQIVISVVWSDVAVPSLMVSPLLQCLITGEANIIRYLCRLLPATSPYHYEANASFAAIATIDQLLDSCSSATATAADKRTTAKFIGSFETRLKSWRAGVSVFGKCGDVALWSALKQLSGQGAQLTPYVAKWLAAHDTCFLTGVNQ